MPKLSIETLDKSRPHGYVTGDTQHNIAFTQRAWGVEAWPYDGEGKLIEDALNTKQREVLTERRNRVAAPQAAQPVEPDEPEEDAPVDASEPEDDGEVNLVAWLKGEVRYKPHEVQAVAKKRYGINKRVGEIARFLVEDKHLVRRDEVHASFGLTAG